VLFEEVKCNIKKELKTKSKLIEKVLLPERIYTTDFEILWSGSNKLHADMASDYFTEIPTFISHSNRSWIEVKNNYDSNNMNRLFSSRTQPYIWKEFNLYVNLIKVPDIFRDTFIPKSILHNFFYKVNTKKNKVGEKKFNFVYRTLDEYIHEKTN